MPLIDYKPGSLFKVAQPARKKKKKDLGRNPRQHEDAHLEAIRQCPCLKCEIDPGGEAAHLRITSAEHGKPNAGTAMKPDDKWTLPLCHQCHMEQHNIGELTFWKEVGIDPLKMALALHKASPHGEKMRAICFAAHAIAEGEPIPKDLLMGG